MPAELWTLEADGYWRSEYADVYSARDNLVYGDYRPDASTTGILSDPSELTVYAGNLTTTSANQVIENMWVQGKVIIKHANVTVRNCLIDGATAGPSSPSYASITAYENVATSGTFIDCTITGSIATVYSSNGVQGRDFNLYRCDISGTVDGVGAQYENVGIYGCWIHDLPWYSFDPSHSDGSHNDCIQVHGGSNFTIRGNSLEAGYKGTSCIIVTQDVGATSNVTIDKNWIMSVYPTQAQAVATGINVSQTGASTAAMTGVVITDNIFSALNTWRVNHAGLIDRGTYDIATISGNVYEGTATSAKITRV